jgi:D-arabinose 1-dehydrogenase-like Zn-dependent alcohol dehydrogenase
MGSPREFQDFINFMEQHKIKPTIYKNFSLDQAVEAIETLSKGQQIGKIVLTH